ncbi:MAG TPA: hypothetical protein VGM92_06230, partial [Candidatus Kapabacteria bacterium]
MFFSGFNRRERYTIGILSAIAFLLRVPLAFRPERMLTQLPYGDDAYYLFSIARNIASGHGITIDGTHLTNGFQPLILLFYVPIFYLCGAESWLAVRLTFIVNGLIAALAVWMIAATVRTLERQPKTIGLTAPMVAAAIWTATFQLLVHTTNGLETGLLSLVLMLDILFYAKIRKSALAKRPVSTSQWILFGFLLGFTVLARIDAAFLVAILVAHTAWERKFRPAILIGVVAVLASLPWWYYNLHYFGNLMPISGQAERSWPLSPFDTIASSVKTLSEIATLVFYLPGSLGPTIRSIWAIL